MDDTILHNKYLVLDIEGPLHFGISAAPIGLQWYALEGGRASSIGKGSLSLQWQLAEALSLQICLNKTRRP